jgi:hypothetical protein
MIVSVGDQLCAGLYRLHSRFARVVNCQGDHGLLTLATEETGAGPRNIVLSQLPGNRFTSLEMSQCAIFWGDTTYSFTPRQIYDSALELLPQDATRFYHNLNICRAYLLQYAAPESLVFLLDDSRPHSLAGFAGHIARHIAEGVARITAGDVAAGVRTIRGCGFGLTPSGDDFLAGMMVALHVRQQLKGVNCKPLLDIVYQNCQSGNIFTDTFLTLAWQCRLTARIKEFVQVLACGEDPRLITAVRHLLKMGETSGADFATGFLQTSCVRA